MDSALGMLHPVAQHRSLLSRVAVLLVASTLLGPPLAAETWTSLRGTHSVDAKMLGLWGDSVILLLSNGRRVSVKLDALRSESRIQARELARSMNSSREERINALKGQAVAAAAPAPNPLPVPPAAPEYVPPQPNQPPANFFAQVDQALASGHILAIYDSLPPSYRQDVNEIVRASAQQVDPSTWAGLVGTVQKLGDLIETRQKWFVSSPRVQALPPEQREMAEGPLITLAGLLRVGLQPEAMQLEKLQTMDFRQWLFERDQAMAPYLAQLFNQMGADSLRQINIESDNNGVVVASINMEGSQKKVTYVMVEGYWVPKSLADQWSASVQAWKQDPRANLVAALTSASAALQPIAPFLDALASSRDAVSFHQTMESVFTPAETIITSVAAMMGRGATGGRGAAGYGSYEDMMYEEGMDMYDEDMEMEMEMEMEMDMEMEMEE